MKELEKQARKELVDERDKEIRQHIKISMKLIQQMRDTLVQEEKNFKKFLNLTKSEASKQILKVLYTPIR